MSENIGLKKIALVDVSNKIGFHVQGLDKFKSELPAIPDEELVDAYVDLNTFSKRIDEMTTLMRAEFITDDGRFFRDNNARVDEKGHRYLEGNDHILQAQKRVSKPKIDQKIARVFFEERGLLNKVSDIQISLSTEDVKKIGLALMQLGTESTIFSKLFKGSETGNKKSAKELLTEVLDTIQSKGEVSINEDKVSALVSLEEITINEIEHLFETKVTYALIEPKSK